MRWEWQYHIRSERLSATGALPGEMNLQISPGSVSLASNPGTARSASSLAAFNFDVFPVDATHLKFIETDSLPYHGGRCLPPIVRTPQAETTYSPGLDLIRSMEVLLHCGGYSRLRWKRQYQIGFDRGHQRCRSRLHDQRHDHGILHRFEPRGALSSPGTRF